MARIVMIAYTNYAIDARVKRHAQALADRGDRVDVICLANPQQGNCDGVNVIGIRMPRYRGDHSINYLFSYLRFFMEACSVAIRQALVERYDVAIVCSMPDAVVFAALPLKLMGTKLVLDVHDTMPELFLDKFPGRRGFIGASLLKLEERVSAFFADRVLAVHELHRKRLEDAGVHPRKLKVVVNVPDQRIFSLDKTSSESDAQQVFTVVCHGTLARRLGIDTALQAIALLRERIPDLRLKIIGSGDYLPDIKFLIQRLSLQDRVQLLPPVNLEVLPSVLRGASLGLIPNLSSSATNLMLPVKLMEYAALGIPILAARLKTINYYFDDESVRFFEPNNAEDLANGIQDLRFDIAAREALAGNALRIVETLSWPDQRKTYFEAVDSLLSLPATSSIKLSAANRQ